MISLFFHFNGKICLTNYRMGDNIYAGGMDMKVYLSCDIEGSAGVAHWDECTHNHPDYEI